MLRWEGSGGVNKLWALYPSSKHPLSPARSRPGISRIEKLQFKFLTNTKRITLYSRDVQLARNLTPNWTEFDRISLNWFLLDFAAASAWHLVARRGQAEIGDEKRSPWPWIIFNMCGISQVLLACTSTHYVHSQFAFSIPVDTGHWSHQIRPAFGQLS